MQWKVLTPDFDQKSKLVSQFYYCLHETYHTNFLLLLSDTTADLLSFYKMHIKFHENLTSREPGCHRNNWPKCRLLNEELF